jgi:hypothetical protein
MRNPHFKTIREITYQKSKKNYKIRMQTSKARKVKPPEIDRVEISANCKLKKLRIRNVGKLKISIVRYLEKNNKLNNANHEHNRGESKFNKFGQFKE